jgi:hypothetical protein
MEISDGAIIKCSHESCVKVVNKSNLQPKPRVQLHTRDRTLRLCKVKWDVRIIMYDEKGSGQSRFDGSV